MPIYFRKDPISEKFYKLVISTDSDVTEDNDLYLGKKGEVSYARKSYKFSKLSETFTLTELTAKESKELIEYAEKLVNERKPKEISYCFFFKNGLPEIHKCKFIKWFTSSTGLDEADRVAELKVGGTVAVIFPDSYFYDLESCKAAATELFEKRIKRLNDEISNYRKEIIDIQEMKE